MNDKKFDFKVGDTYECPEGHEAKIVLVQEDMKFIAVKCPEKHFEKFVVVYDKNDGWGRGKSHTKRRRKKYARNMVFIITFEGRKELMVKEMEDITHVLNDAGFVIVHRQKRIRKITIEVGKESRDKIWKYKSQLNELLKPFGYSEPWFSTPTFHSSKGMWVSMYEKDLG